MKSILLRASTAALLATALSFGAARGGSNQYIENFQTTTYLDAINTTAAWESSPGRLRLAPVVPSLLGAYDTPDVAYDVAVSGDLAFVADNGSGLQILDITHPASPTLLGTYDTPGNAFGVAVSGDLAFVADWGSGLQIINIANPASPSLVGTYHTPGTALGVAVAGDLAFVADYSYGLYILNIANPASPSLVGTFDTSGNPYHVTVDGDFAFVADGPAGLQIINITNPASPTLVGTYDTPGLALGVAVDGDLAFVADHSGGLQIIDITNPANPTLRSSFPTPGYVYGVAVSGDFAFLGDYTSGLEVVDITNPAAPFLAGAYATPAAAYRVAVDGEFAFVADHTSGLQIVDTAALSTFAPLGAYDTPGSSYGVAVAGNLAFVADGASGLQIIDVSNPWSSSLVGTFNAGASVYGVAVAGDLAFVSGLQALRVANIANPAAPSLVGGFDTPNGSGLAVTVAGDLAFVADGNNGLLIVNISNPASPSLVGTYTEASFNAFDVAVAGDLAYLADSFSGLRILNITNPASPSLVGSYSLTSGAVGVAVAGDLAFLACNGGGLQILNISNPASPALVGSFTGPYSMLGVSVTGNLAVVAASFGLVVIDVSNPASPSLIGTCTTPGNTQRAVVAGGIAYAGAGPAGLRLTEIFNREFHARDNVGRSLKLNATSDPIKKVRLATTQIPAEAWDISANGGTNWQAIAPDNAWHDVTTAGNDLRWRSTLSQTAPGVNPTVSRIQIDWLAETPLINAVSDIPNDQGGWVRLKLARSSRDFAAEASLPIANYAIWRRVDDAALVDRIAAAGRGAESVPASMREALGALPITRHQERIYMESAGGGSTGALPAGTWALFASIPALQQDAYLVDLPTQADSTSQGPHRSVYVATAHTTTPSVWYASPADSGYSIDNIAPAVPSNLAAAYHTGHGNTLSWSPSPDADFQSFKVYRSTDPSFTPSASTLVQATTSTGWVDPSFDVGGYQYKVTAVDHAGNESAPAIPGAVTGAEDSVFPAAFALPPSGPNPFFPTTLLRYDVPDHGGVMSLRIYDSGGRLVRSLVEGVQPTGRYAVAWDGRDDAGRPVAAGVYFYRLTASDRAMAHKLVLMK